MEFTDEEKNLIDSVRHEGADAWKNPLLKELKAKIKSFYRTEGRELCCYCRKDFQGEFNMVIDIEHILPKGNPLFTKYMFDMDNLNIACKRCNMNVKGGNINFIVDIDTIIPDYKLSEKYLFIHPNIDVYKDNLKFVSYREDESKLTKYFPLTEKGKFTYKFFKLNEIETDSFDEAQGISPRDKEIKSNMLEKFRKNFFDYISKL